METFFIFLLLFQLSSQIFLHLSQLVSRDTSIAYNGKLDQIRHRTDEDVQLFFQTHSSRSRQSSSAQRCSLFGSLCANCSWAYFRCSLFCWCRTIEIQSNSSVRLLEMARRLNIVLGTVLLGYKFIAIEHRLFDLLKSSAHAVDTSTAIDRSSNKMYIIHFQVAEAPQHHKLGLMLHDLHNEANCELMLWHVIAPQIHAVGIVLNCCLIRDEDIDQVFFHPACFAMLSCEVFLMVTVSKQRVLYGMIEAHIHLG